MKYVPKRLDRTRDISRGKTDPRVLAFRTARAVAVMAALYLLLGVGAEELARRIPTDWEARFPVQVSGSEVDPALERVREIMDSLLAAGRLRPLPYRLILIDQPEPNAFAYPGGTIGVTRGLLDQVKSETGLAMVIGHELGHHHRRHVLRRLGRAVVVLVPLAALMSTSSDLLIRLFDLVESKYSRDHEREADRIGLTLVHRVYGSTDGALEFFEFMADEHGDRAGMWSSLAATHPPSKERLETLAEYARRLASDDGVKP